MPKTYYVDLCDLSTETDRGRYLKHFNRSGRMNHESLLCKDLMTTPVVSKTGIQHGLKL